MSKLNQFRTRVFCLASAVAVLSAPNVFANNQTGANNQAGAIHHPVQVANHAAHHNGPQNIAVLINKTQVLHLPTNASSVIVGNPSIADISIYSPDTIFVIGRGYGETNLIALDEDGKTILQSNILVRRDMGPTNVHITNLGEGQSTYNCAPECLPSPILGDNSDFISKFSSRAQSISSPTPVNGTGTGGFSSGYAGGNNALPANIIDPSSFPPGPSQAQAQALAQAMSQGAGAQGGAQSPGTAGPSSAAPFATGQEEF